MTNIWSLIWWERIWNSIPGDSNSNYSSFWCGWSTNWDLSGMLQWSIWNSIMNRRIMIKRLECCFKQRHETTPTANHYILNEMAWNKRNPLPLHHTHTKYTEGLRLSVEGTVPSWRSITQSQPSLLVKPSDMHQDHFQRVKSIVFYS